MSEALNDVPQQPRADVSAEAGSALRAAREATGMHVAALAAVLKVPVDKLQALEAGRYHELPNLTFARALAQSVCRVLKVDPKPILQGLPQVTEARLEPKEGALNAPMPDRRPAVFSGGASAQRSHKSWLLAGAVVVLAGVLWWVLPHRALDGGEPVATVAVAPSVDTNAPIAPPDMPKEVIAPAESRTEAQAVLPASSPSTGAASMPTGAAPAISTPAPVVVPAVAPTVPATVVADAVRAAPTTTATPDADGILRLVAHQPTWVQVMAGGKQVVQRTLQSGESLAVPGNGTLAVTVGRVDESEVYVRGQRFDLAPYTRNNVARFEVK